MKKTITILSILLLTSCATLQTTPKESLSTNKEVTNLTANQTNLYIAANDWMIDQFKNADSVIQFSDKPEGILIGKYFLYGNVYTIYGSTADNRVFAKISIKVKDNYAKIEVSPVTDIKITSKSTIPKIRKSIIALIDSFEIRMKSIQ